MVVGLLMTTPARAQLAPVSAFKTKQKIVLVAKGIDGAMLRSQLSQTLSRPVVASSDENASIRIWVSISERSTYLRGINLNKSAQFTTPRNDSRLVEQIKALLANLNEEPTQQKSKRELPYPLVAYKLKERPQKFAEMKDWLPYIPASSRKKRRTEDATWLGDPKGR